MARHTFKVKVHTTAVGRQRIDVQVDGGTWTTGYGGDVQSSLTVTVAATTSINGYLHLMRITNDTTGKMVWSYPNEAERLRLITKTNVRTDRGVFEPADSAQPTRIKTAIDLRGNFKSLTLVCKAFIPSHAADGKLYASGLITQGNYISYRCTCSFTVREDHRTGQSKIINLQYTNSSGAVTDLNFVLVDNSIFNRMVVFAAQFDYERSLMLLFVDGVEVARRSGALLPFGQGLGGDFLDAVSIMHNPYAAYLSGHSMDYAMMFNKALTAAQIATFK
ncbi:hypothetical protein SDC9_96611 [bioreactor metagenome]|uniref:LamG-like jellyroll fold domain-containing protein n=1 Tax=bioreactor metagenome TaxID=1076179 RepID=A0A645AA45_9ZZZZ